MAKGKLARAFGGTTSRIGGKLSTLTQAGVKRLSDAGVKRLAEMKPTQDRQPAAAAPPDPGRVVLARMDAARAALQKIHETADHDPDRAPSAWETRMNRHHSGSAATPGAAPSTQPRSRRGELYDSLYGPTGGGAMDINSMRNDWPAAMGRARAALETAYAEVQGILPGVEHAPVDESAKDMYRELSGLLSALPEQVDRVNTATHQADEQYWRDFAEGGLDNGKAWTND